MNRTIPGAALALALAFAGTAIAEADKKGCADHPLFPTRMPDYFITDCKSADFDAYDFQGLRGAKNRQEGRYTFITYRLEKGKAPPVGPDRVQLLRALGD